MFEGLDCNLESQNRPCVEGQHSLSSELEINLYFINLLGLLALKIFVV